MIGSLLSQSMQNFGRERDRIAAMAHPKQSLQAVLQENTEATAEVSADASNHAREILRVCEIGGVSW